MKNIYNLLMCFTLVPGLFIHLYAKGTNQQKLEISSFEQQDTNGDGNPDLAIIECNCISNEDRILVFDDHNDMAWSSDWQAGTDELNDIWIFDIYNDNKINLIMVFSQSESEVIAGLYDDVDGDGNVSYSVASDGKIRINESPWWTLEVRSPVSWLADDGSVNLNISARIDKPVANGLNIFLDQTTLTKWMPHDGSPDSSFELIDADQNGIAETAVLTLLAQFPSGWGIGRSKLWVNVQGKSTSVPDSALFWPFIDFRSRAENSFRYFDVPPRVKMNWETASIEGFILPGYPIGEGYHLNNMQYLNKADVNYPDFEAPHAYYDLADNHDAFPELNIRLFYGYKPANYPWQEVRYSWNQNNLGTLIWDYKIGLLGKYPIDEQEIVNLAGYKLHMVPYEKIPYWVTERKWLLTTFVAREQGQQWSSEGIYDWTPWGGANPLNKPVNHGEELETAFQYASGSGIESPGKYFNVITEGFRGEYSFIQAMKPELYLSGIDRRLHLLNAEHGLYTVDSHINIEYGNLNKDEYIDEWIKIKDGVLEESIHVSPPYLFYTIGDSLVIKRIQESESVFLTLPPRNHSDWSKLGQKLDDYSTDVPGYDFGAIIENLDGPFMIINGVAVKDFRATQGSGIRFVLELQPGFTFTKLDWLGLNQLMSGNYLVELSNSFTIKPLTPAQIKVDLQLAGMNEPKTFDQILIQINLANVGLEDKQNSHLLVAAQNGTETTQVISQTVGLLSQTPLRLNGTWQPNKEGEWQLVSRVVDQNGLELAETHTSIYIQKGEIGSPGTIARLSSYGFLIPILALLLVSAFLCAFVFSSAWTKSY